MGAFSGCKSLESISIPDSISKMGENVFFNCKSLVSITLSQGMTEIPYAAFYYCENLSSVVIPKSITKISDYAFCSSGMPFDVYYEGSKEQWNGISKGIYSVYNGAVIHYDFVLGQE
jgi:hypothetical protein